MKTKFNKTYFTIKEVSSMLTLKPYVLRYWETVFPVLNPRKHNGNRRMYTEKDIETLKVIKHLLYDKRYTIKGANEVLKDNQEVKQLKLEFEEKIDNNYLTQKIKEVITILRGGKNER